jgi:hypothetical protein
MGQLHHYAIKQTVLIFQQEKLHEHAIDIGGLSV